MRDPTFWILARAAGLTAYVAPDARPCSPASSSSRSRSARPSASPRSPTCTASSRCSGSARSRCTGRARARLDREDLAGCALVPGPRALPAALDGARRPRGRADGRSSTPRSRCAGGSARATGAACTGPPTRSSPRPRSTACAAGTDSSRPWAIWLYVGARRRRRRRDRLARLSLRRPARRRSASPQPA